jgi:N,N'-diacetyllegionaminate synthase
MGRHLNASGRETVALAQAIQIGGRTVGAGYPAYLIAEVAQAHDGSLGLAHSFVDAAADAGADAIKFQTHIAAAESTLDEPFRIKFSKQDDSRFDYWRRMEFSEAQWAGLAQHARDRGIDFLSSAFSVAAVEMLERLEVPAWKVGSGEFGSTDLIGAMCRTGKPIILSTGMSTWQEIERSASVIDEAASPLAIMQCTSLYPTPMDKVGLNVLPEMRTKFDCPVGLSDHSASPWPALAAIARGFDLIEVHVTFDRAMFGPDAVASLTLGEFRQLREARDAWSLMDRAPVDKDQMATTLAQMRGLFTKSLAPVRTLDQGEVVTEACLTLKKPGTGIPAADLAKVVGRRVVRAVSADRLLQWDDLGQDA